MSRDEAAAAATLTRATIDAACYIHGNSSSSCSSDSHNTHVAQIAIVSQVTSYLS